MKTKLILAVAFVQFVTSTSYAGRSVEEYGRELKQSEQIHLFEQMGDSSEDTLDSGLDVDMDSVPNFQNEPGSTSTLQELQEAAIKQLGTNGKWAFEFIHIGADGKETILSQYNVHQALKPASTQKMFSSYLAFTHKTYPPKYLAALLHVSHNSMANSALNSVAKNLNTDGVALLKSSYAGLEDSDKYVPIDGSGYSALNRVTVRFETSLLRQIHKDPRYNEFKLLLAHAHQKCSYDTEHTQLGKEQHAGHSSLEKYFTPLAGRIYAKTGTLGTNLVSSRKGSTKSLTGFIEDKDGQGVILFSIIGDYIPQVVNGKKRSTGLKAAYAKIQAIVQAHADYVDNNK